MPHPETIVGGVTTGHNAVHEDLAEWWNSQEGTLRRYVPAGATESDIASALADVHAAGGGVVELVGPAYTASSNPAFSITLPTVSLIGQGSGATVINYTGSGDCIRVAPSPTTVVQMGQLARLTIDGSGAGAGAKGVRHIDAGTTMAFDDVVIRNFSGVGSVGCCIENVGLWNERAAGSRLQLLHNTVGLQLIGTGVNNSLFYHRWSDLRLNVGANQIGIQAKGTALLQGGDWNVLGNIDGNNGVFVDLADTAVWGGIFWFKGEQTVGTGGKGRQTGGSAYWAASGSFNATGCTDSGNIISPWEFTPDGRLLHLFPAVPTVAMQAGAGTAPPAAVVGTNSNSSKGNITVGTGASPPAAPGVLFRVTFAHTFPVVPVPDVWAFGLAAAQLKPYISAVTATYFEVSIEVTPAASQANSVYGFFYSVSG